MPDPEQSPPASATVPDPFGGLPGEDVLEGGPRAPVRRTTVLAGAMLAGAVLTAVLLARPDRPAAPVPPPSPAVTADPDLTVSGIHFTDTRYGYALLEPCRLPGSCRGVWTLLRTTDAGRHWRRVGSPLDTRTAESVQVYARGRRDVALVVDGVRFVSTDAGVGWRQAPLARVGGPVDEVPPGDDVGYYCPVATTSPACRDRLSTYDPVTGTVRPLVPQPPLAGDPDTLQVFTLTAAGEVWVLATQDRGQPQLLHSPDRGRHWATVPMPGQPHWFNPMLLATPDGRWLYLVNRQAVTYLVSRVWRLDDPARGWVPVVTAGPDRRIEDVQVLPGGELRYADLAGNAWLTEGRATRLVPAPKALVDGRRVNVNLAQVVDGMVVATPVIGVRGDRILTSIDGGYHWRVHPVGRG